jgi:hypothetical protein
MESLRNLARIASRRVQYPHSYRPNCRVLIRSTLAETGQRSLRLTRQLRTTTKAAHEKAVGTVKLAPRTNYQPTSATTWIISNGSVSADKEAIALAKGLGLPWVIKRVQWHQGALSCIFSTNLVLVHEGLLTAKRLLASALAR